MINMIETHTRHGDTVWVAQCAVTALSYEIVGEAWASYLSIIIMVGQIEYLAVAAINDHDRPVVDFYQWCRFNGFDTSVYFAGTKGQRDRWGNPIKWKVGISDAELARAVPGINAPISATE